MSCNYAEGLSPYEHKGVLGVPEKFDSIEKLNEKCGILAELIKTSKHVVVHTGAGISTSAGIPDFRGPNGVWTLEKKGKKPSINVSFTDAKPTKTHMILRKLVESNKVQYIISQNIDGLHLKSGLSRKYLAELHGNMFIDECNLCKRQFVRSCPVETVGKKCSGVPCAAGHAGARPCRGRLYDGVLDWEHSLPENDLLMSELHSSLADLSICLGTTLQIIPSGNLPIETVKYGGKLVICNLQPTKHDNKADLVINYYVDDILEKIMSILNLETPEYNEADNFIKLADNTIIDWTIRRKDVLALEKVFKVKCKGVKKKRVLVKKRNSTEIGVSSVDDKSKVIKLENRDLNNPASDVILVKNERNRTEIGRFRNDKSKVIKVENRDVNGTATDVILVRNKGNSTVIGTSSDDDKSKVVKVENREVNGPGSDVILIGNTIKSTEMGTSIDKSKVIKENIREEDDNDLILVDHKSEVISLEINEECENVLLCSDSEDVILIE
ncbi:NAD-dependent protein deacetylase Sirt6 [Maniola hyperantus]|uniref:NAD-dependent protein deacetylase Sirt6 n=1 Tax=Aphantopus hyperantus TaxID=2795564 RepID=UPI001567EE83|nr:NAD-dependent protein deacetylase Sirt6 [Maniola hyperantus]